MTASAASTAARATVPGWERALRRWLGAAEAVVGARGRGVAPALEQLVQAREAADEAWRTERPELPGRAPTEISLDPVCGGAPGVLPRAPQNNISALLLAIRELDDTDLAEDDEDVAPPQVSDEADVAVVAAKAVDGEAEPAEDPVPVVVQEGGTVEKTKCKCGCGRPAKTRGLAQYCYDRARREGTLEQVADPRLRPGGRLYGAEARRAEPEAPVTPQLRQGESVLEPVREIELDDAIDIIKAAFVPVTQLGALEAADPPNHSDDRLLALYAEARAQRRRELETQIRALAYTLRGVVLPELADGRA